MKNSKIFPKNSHKTRKEGRKVTEERRARGDLTELTATAEATGNVGICLSAALPKELIIVVSDSVTFNEGCSLEKANWR